MIRNSIPALLFAMMSAYASASPMQLSTISGVQSVHTFNSNPDVILIAQTHPNVKSAVDTNNMLGTGPAVEKICYDLFDNYGVRNLVIEGLEPYHVEGFRQGRSFNSSGWTGLVERLVKSRDWNLYPGEDSEIKKKIDAFERPIRRIQSDFMEEYRLHLEAIYNQILIVDGDNLKLPSDRQDLFQRFVQQAFDLAKKSGERRLESYLDGKWDTIYDLHVTQRDNHVARICRSITSRGERVIVVYGSRHVDSMLEAFEGMNTAVLVPYGIQDKDVYSVDKKALEHIYSIAPDGTISFDHKLKKGPNGLIVIMDGISME